MKHVFIVNPSSGTGKFKDVIEWIHHNLKDKYDYEVHLTRHKGDATQIAEKYSDPDTVLYAVGGDGTVNEVLNGMSLEVTLGVIPTGTGNDFYRMIGKAKGNLDILLESTVLKGHTETVDFGTVNNHRFVNCANFGLDAAINEEVNNQRDVKMPRELLYLKTAIKHLFKMKPLRYTLHMNGEKRTIDSIITAVMNGCWYGSGFKSAPRANIRDGHLDVCIVSPVTVMRAFSLLPRYKAGTHEGIKEVTFLETQKFEIDSDTPLLYGLDGEIFESKHLDVILYQRLLKLRVPVGVNL